MRPLRGGFVVADAVVAETERLLPTYRGPLGDHEGIVFWLGREIEDLALFTTAIAPQAETGPGRVNCTREQMAEAVEAARDLSLGLLAQVHTHPHDWIEHSVGDDEMVFMPYEGMLSIVVPWYGRIAMRPFANLGVHQYQDGGWVRAEPASVTRQITIVPAKVDLR